METYSHCLPHAFRHSFPGKKEGINIYELSLNGVKNHLDLEAIQWLEGYLTGYEGSSSPCTTCSLISSNNLLRIYFSRRSEA